jgi:hypothetical protein
MIKMPKAKPKGGPQNIPGIGVVSNTRFKPGPYKLITAMRAVTVMPKSIARFLRGPQSGLEFNIDDLRVRTESTTPYWQKTIVT